MKKAILISCFDWYKGRLDIVRNYLLEKGYDVDVLLSDFNHVKKMYHIHKYKECKYIHVFSYKKNISVNRIISHWMFGQSVKKYLKEHNPQFIYVIIPPNNVAKICKEYKRLNKEVKLVADIIDLWPESMPLGKIKKTFPFNIWKGWRDEAILNSDYVFTECDYYRYKLNRVLDKKKTSTLYLSNLISKKEGDYIKSLISKRKESEIIRFAYLGSMNNILDIEGICDVIKDFIAHGYRTELHAIGNGENRYLFEEKVKKTGCLTYFYGVIFNNVEKIRIMVPCNYAFNMMKKNIQVGLTIKSLDYLAMGIPIINNIKGDTWEIVEKYKVGVNVQGDYLKQLENVKSGREVIELFEQLFSNESLTNNVKKGLSEVVI